MLRYLSIPAAIAASLLCCVLSTAAFAATDIHFWHSMDGAPGEVLAKLIARFNTSQKDVQVIATFKGTYVQTLQAGIDAARDSKAPDILQVYDVGTADVMANTKFIKPVWQIARESGLAFDRENYFPPAASLYSDAKGQLIALPFNSSTPVLYFNRDAFTKAGLDPDKPPKTWPDMQPMLLDLQKAGAECPYITGGQSWIHLENLSAWHNEPVASQNNGLSGDRPELMFNTRLALRHISLMSAWNKSELFKYAGRGNGADEKFAKGECAMLTASSAAYSDIARNAKFKLGVAQLPYYDDFPGAPFNTLVGGAALWVMAGKPPAEYRAVARFLDFLASPVVAAEWHQGTGYIPITHGAYLATKSTGYYDQHPDMEIAVKQLMGIRAGNLARGVRLRHFADIRAIVNEELDMVWSDTKAPKTALDEAVERGNAVLRKSAPAAAGPSAPKSARCPKGGCK